MATVTPTKSHPNENTDLILLTWEGFATNGDVGSPFGAPAYSDKTVHVKGNFGTGGTIVVEGSNDGVTYKTLTDPQGNALSFTAEGIELISESPLYIRPRLSAGTSTIDIDVFIVGRRH